MAEPKLTPEQQEELFRTLKSRFEKHLDRHESLKWDDVQTRLESRPDKLWSLHEMERTGGEPDVVQEKSHKGSMVFYDLSKQSPKGRRSICYDPAALESRKNINRITVQSVWQKRWVSSC